MQTSALLRLPREGASRDREDTLLELVDVSEVSAGLFIVGVIFILLVGGLLSMGILRFFQLKKGQGWSYMIGSVVSLVAFILVVDQWFA